MASVWWLLLIWDARYICVAVEAHDATDVKCFSVALALYGSLNDRRLFCVGYCSRGPNLDCLVYDHFA
ncbi:Uncharacterized protein TCM_041255 [Theobroma cacao]|uniref:Secreted protein n=1 Tax=Theobroma cacao TaxID=3641 RepID=A0A061GTY8_THECC|nr:Uncharacterized protein TCM_041255 [Theobroma cacao]